MSLAIFLVFLTRKGERVPETDEFPASGGLKDADDNKVNSQPQQILIEVFFAPLFHSFEVEKQLMI